MTVKIYRYRKIESALAEIANGTFYFASREELNDPIEGYVKLYFQGDQPAWEGLFKNYVCSLFISIINHIKGLCHNVVLVDINYFKNDPLGQLLENLSKTFLNGTAVQNLVKLYGNNDVKCSSKELQLILRVVHYIAFKLCTQNLKNSNLFDLPEEYDDEFPFEAVQAMNRTEWIKFVNSAENTIADAIELATSYAKTRQKDFPTSDTTSFKNRNQISWDDIRVNFPKIYVEHLKKLIYPDAYIVCFSKTPKDSAMWGNYAQNHQGICFIYETQEINGKDYLPVDSKKKEVRRVTYDDDVIERNFFNTLGKLNHAQIQAWLSGKDNKVSKLIDTFSKNNIESWREKYWSDYIEKFHRKNSAWLHEEEYRILLYDLLYRYEDKKNRCLKYDPLALKGIIFGINTSINDKLRFIQKIKQAENGFKHVEFFQAEYNENTQEIFIRKKVFL